MADLDITKATEIKSATISDTGHKMLLRFTSSYGTEFGVSFPVQEIGKLLNWCAAGFQEAPKRLGKPDDRILVELKEAQVGFIKDAPESPLVVLSMILDNGGAISYWIPPHFA